MLPELSNRSCHYKYFSSASLIPFKVLYVRSDAPVPVSLPLLETFPLSVASMYRTSCYSSWMLSIMVNPLPFSPDVLQTCITFIQCTFALIDSEYRVCAWLLLRLFPSSLSISLFQHLLLFHLKDKSPAYNTFSFFFLYVFLSTLFQHVVCLCVQTFLDFYRGCRIFFLFSVLFLVSPSCIHICHLLAKSITRIQQNKIP